MHGGGAGYFDADGQPGPRAGSEGRGERGVAANQAQRTTACSPRSAPTRPGFRTVAVSYCSHDVYAASTRPIRTTRTPTPDGKPRTTNGILATKAAIQFAQEHYPTTKTFLHGGSAGSAGTFGDGVVDAAPGDRAGGSDRRREHRERRGVPGRRTRPGSAPTTTTRPAPRRSRPGCTPTSRTSRTSPTSS